jgi:hypothetical protein
MLKTKGWMLVVMVLAAALLPATPAHSSELVKLGKLIVTGKRGSVAPSAALEPRPAVPAASSREGGAALAPSASDRWFPKAAGEAGTERGGTPAVLPSFKLSVDAVDAATEAGELQRPAPEGPRERISKSPPSAINA